MASMGMAFGLPNATGSKLCKRKFRWLLKIEDISAQGVRSLPPLKSARPSLSFGEMRVNHPNERIYLPSTPEWKPINLILYDVKNDGDHPIFEWLKRIYDPETGEYQPSVGTDFYQDAILELYDGCGKPVERWIYEQAWPQNADFGDLDMGNSDVLTCDLTLRYARAYIETLN
jgi:hypothetical protein